MDHVTRGKCPPGQRCQAWEGAVGNSSLSPSGNTRPPLSVEFQKRGLRKKELRKSVSKTMEPQSFICIPSSPQHHPGSAGGYSRGKEAFPGAGDMGQWVKVLTAKPDTLSSVHVVRVKKWLHHVVP